MVRSYTLLKTELDGTQTDLLVMLEPTPRIGRDWAGLSCIMLRNTGRLKA